MAAAVVAVAMGIKLSVDPSENIQPAERLKAGFILALGGLLSVLKRVVLPHFCLSGGLWVLTVYAIYKIGSADLSLPQVLFWIWLLVLIGLTSGLAFGYALLTSFFCALKNAATYAEDFFYELFEELKAKIRSQIDIRSRQSII